MPYKDNLLALPGIYYAWAETILDKQKEMLIDPRTHQEDIYQNMVLNVNLGLSSYGYLNIMEAIGKLLYNKKLKTAQYVRATKEIQKQKLKKEIQALKNKALDKLALVEKYHQTHRSEAVYSYIQFQSMNGKKKFMKVMKVGCCRKFLIKRILFQHHAH